jgi:hypothetical protein
MLINGPINVVRLEGSINSIKKILYVFFDYHANINLQTECESYDSKDIVTYFYDIFKSTTKPVDFFFEVKSSTIGKNNISPFKNIYINNIYKFYNKSKFDDSVKKNIKNNVRFHYLDIRDYLEKNIYYYDDLLYKSVKNILSNKDIFSNDYNNLVQACTQLIYELEIYKNFFDSEINKKLSRTKNLNIKSKDTNPKYNILYFLNKITKKYKNKDIINKVKNNYFNDILEEINICINNLNELRGMVIEKENYVYRYYDEKGKFVENRDKLNLFSSYYNTNEMNQFVYKLDYLSDNIHMKILYIFLKITDLFFLRRFLDKDYITNGISYTGSAHSINYINFLVSNFDFKITHFSYSEERSLEKLNDIAKNDIYLLDYTLHPQKLIQCSDLSSFPVNDFY